MRELLLSLLYSLSCGLRSRAGLHLEIVALRHQLAVLHRKVPTRPQLKSADRWLWVVLARLWSNWRSGLVIVKPETVVAWHRQGFRLYWTWRSRRRLGRPKIDTEVREMIRRMTRANPLWGAPRIHGQVLKLGIEVSQGTVAKYMVRSPTPSSQSWLKVRVSATIWFLSTPLFQWVCRADQRQTSESSFRQEAGEGSGLRTV